MDFTGWKWLNESQMINENGEGGMRYYSDFKLEKVTVDNLRAGK